MAAIVLSDDGVTQTVQLDDGRVIRAPSQRFPQQVSQTPVSMDPSTIAPGTPDQQVVNYANDPGAAGVDAASSAPQSAVRHDAQATAGSSQVAQVPTQAPPGSVPPPATQEGTGATGVDAVSTDQAPQRQIGELPRRQANVGPITPQEIEGNKNLMLSDQQRAEQDLASVQAKNIDQQAKLRDEQEARLQAKQRQDEAVDSLAKGQVQDRVSQWDAARKQRDDWSLDPSRMFKRAGTLQKAAWAFGTMLSGLANSQLMAAQALAGGTPTQQKNRSLEAISSELDQDIDAQKSEYEKLGAKAGDARSAYELAYRQFGDDRAARAAARVTMLDGFKREADTAALHGASVEVQARAKVASAQIGGLIAQNQQDLDQTLYGRARDAQQLAIQRGQLGEQIRHQRAEDVRGFMEIDRQAENDELNYEARRNAQAAAAAKGQKDTTVLDLDGKPLVQIEDKTKREEVQTILDGRAKMKALREQGKELFKNGWVSNVRDARLRAKQQAFVTDWAAARKLAEGGAKGRLTSEDTTTYGFEDTWGRDYPLDQIETGYKDSVKSGNGRMIQKGVDRQALIDHGLDESPNQKDEANRQSPDINPRESFEKGGGATVQNALGAPAPDKTRNIPVVDPDGKLSWYTNDEASELVSRVPGYRIGKSADVTASKKQGEDLQMKRVEDRRSQPFQPTGTGKNPYEITY